MTPKGTSTEQLHCDAKLKSAPRVIFWSDQGGSEAFCVRRRDFIAVFSGVVAWPVAPRSQSQQKHIAIFQPSIPVTELSQEGPHPEWRAFFAELERLGFTEGHNLEVERYSGEGRSESY